MKCSDKMTEVIHTGWNEITIRLRAYERFENLGFFIKYYSYSTEDEGPIIRLSFDPILTCSSTIPQNETERTFMFSFKSSTNAEVLVNVCVFPAEEIMSSVLSGDSNDLSSRWTTSCNQKICKLETDTLAPPLSGNYTFTVRIRRQWAQIKFKVLLTSPPEIFTSKIPETKAYYPGKPYQFQCTLLGEKEPKIQWAFYPYDHILQCLNLVWSNFTEAPTTTLESDNWSVKQSKLDMNCWPRFYNLRVTITSDKSGCLVCRAENITYGTAIWVPFPVAGNERDFFVMRSKNESIVGDVFSMTCTASRFTHNSVTWEVPPAYEDGIQRNSWINNLTVSETIIFRKISPKHERTYQCKAVKTVPENGKFKSEDVFLNETLSVILSPAFTGKSYLLKNDIVPLRVPKGTDVDLDCSAIGMTPLIYTWVKVTSDGRHLPIEMNSSSETDYVLKAANPSRGEKFMCTVYNNAGNISRLFQFSFIPGLPVEPDKTNGVWNYTTISAISAVLVLIFNAVILLLWYCRKKKKRNVAVGFVPLVCSSGPLEVCIPFDVFWEFPEQRLTLQEKLGQGEYGKVVKAQAYGICAHENVTTVAIKMLKANADRCHKKALFSELKILIRLGKHPNVVTLLGAVTKYQSSGRLYIIVEYCEKGSLHRYLQKQRKNFICQVHKETGKLDKSVQTYPFRKQDSSNSTHQSDERMDVGSPASQDEATSSFVNSENVFKETMDHGISTISLSDPNISQEQNTEPPLTTVDLIKFAFQCARGMEYISSRKLVHRDLSTRNVLLTKDNVIKICDFGLTKDDTYLYNCQKKTPLPIRWMAPESLAQNQFNTKTDVWSFGVLLWEMFSLGDTPYAGIAIDGNFLGKILNGFRLNPPYMSPKEVSKLMTDCWKEIPENRPDFSEIVEVLGNILDEETRNYYLMQDAQYLAMNKIKEQPYEDMDGELLGRWLFETLPDSDTSSIIERG